MYSTVEGAEDPACSGCSTRVFDETTKEEGEKKVTRSFLTGYKTYCTICGEVYKTENGIWSPGNIVTGRKICLARYHTTINTIAAHHPPYQQGLPAANTTRTQTHTVEDTRNLNLLET